MDCFLDTSALVKRYCEEDGTDTVDRLIESGDSEIIISSLAIIEAVSAIRRKQNNDDISQADVNALVSRLFAETLERFAVVPLEDAVFEFSFDLVLEDDLRTLDSLQLSTGLSVAKGLDGLVFVTADATLATVGETRGLDVLNPIEA